MSIQKRLFTGVITFLFFLLLIVIKVALDSRNEFQKGEHALLQKDRKQAILHFSRAIHWYSPWNKAVKRSIEELWKIGTQAEEQRDETLALQAFQALRSSLYSARSFYTPYSQWIEKCDDRIAYILAKQESARSPDHKKIPFTDQKAEILEILKTTTEPNVFWSVIVEIGFIGWIACAIGFIFRVFTEKEGFNPKRAFFWGGLMIFFYAFWVIGMLNA